LRSPHDSPLFPYTTLFRSLEKPIATEKLLLTVDNALRLQRLESENRQLKQRLGKHEIVWQGESMRRVMAQVDRVAASETRVCILDRKSTRLNSSHVKISYA